MLLGYEKDFRFDDLKFSETKERPKMHKTEKVIKELSTRKKQLREEKRKQKL